MLFTGNVSAETPDRSDLAPQSLLANQDFREEFLAAGLLLSHEAINAFIRRQIEKILSSRGEAGLHKREVKMGGSDSIVIAIPGLLKRAGQFAHAGLGTRYGKPVIYVDADLFNDQPDLSDVIVHEDDEVSGWEKLRKLLGKAPKEVRGWITRNIDTPATDAGLSGTAYYGLTSRQIARKIHEDSYPLDPLYKKYAGRIKIEADYITRLVNSYRPAGSSIQESDIFYDPAVTKDVNIAASDTTGAAARAGKISWLEKNEPELKGKLIMSLSMEGNIPEFEGYDARDANTKGGLGAYFGDKLEGLAGIGMASIGVQPGYSHIMRGGKKVKVDYHELIKEGIMVPVFTGKDAITVRAWDEDPEARTDDEEDQSNPKVKVEVYRINRGGTTDYIIMSKVLDILYTDDRVHRFTQEIVFGKAVYQLMERLKLRPDILHLNEAHTVVAAAQMRADEKYNRTAIVYTNHTIVPAGLETFSAGALRTSVLRMMYVIGIPAGKSERFRSVFLRPDGTVDFCYAATRLADVINGVSLEHAVATRKLFETMYGKEFDVHVAGVLNGSGRTWKSDRLLSFESAGESPDDAQLWDIHEAGKEEAFDEVERRTGVRLDQSKLTAWAVRRQVDYKSQYPMLRFLAHIMTADRQTSFTREELKALWFRDIPDLAQGYNSGIVDAVLNKMFANGAVEKLNGLGMQVVVGGPEYMPYWTEEFKRWSAMEAFRGAFVYVPNSDAKLLKMQAVGADICVTMPRPLEEACGTSDQRTGLNGGVNIAINGAGPVEWIEQYDEVTGRGSGFLIDSYTRQTDNGPEADNIKFYHEAPADIFEKATLASRLYYEPGRAKWRGLMFNSYLRANELVTAEAMERRYARSIYVPAVRKKSDSKMIYEMALRDYYNPATGKSGLIAAARELPFLAETGVKRIYLVGLAQNSGTPFEIMDPRNIDPRAGTFEELDSFIKEARKAGIGVVMIDWFANQHVSKRSDICRNYPDRFLYTNVSDGNYWLDRDSVIVKGRDIPPDELARRVALGDTIKERLQEMSRSGALKDEGAITIDGKDIRYHITDREIRKKVGGVDAGALSVVVSESDALFLVSATDLVSLKTPFSRRWECAAQPDLSHPDVIRSAIETGRFWLSKGISGFRVDAAGASFPDMVKENWGVEVRDNLAEIFVSEMRKIRPDCFILFEGFDRHDEYLDLAGRHNCAVYSWKCRNYVTEAISDGGKINTLANYLISLESVPDDLRNSIANLGPEHDAIDFGDPWSRLSYQDANLMYFLYSFLPGYRLIFNGEIYGSSHKFRQDPAKSEPAPDIGMADPGRREARKSLFSFAKQSNSIMFGHYRYLDTGTPWNGIGVARFEEDDIVIGALNLTSNDGWTVFDMKRIVGMQVKPEEMASTHYLRESLMLDAASGKWMELEPIRMSAADIFEKGLGVKVGPKGCEYIRMVKVASPVEDKGSPAEGLRAMYRNRIFADNPVTVKDFAKQRGYSEKTARTELRALAAIGVVKADKTRSSYTYYLTDYFGRAPPAEGQYTIDRIASIPELGLYDIPEGSTDRVRAIVSSILPAGTTNHRDAVAMSENSSQAGGPGARVPAVKSEVAEALGLFSDERVASNLAGGMVYEIRYNAKRLMECPFGVEILKAYIRLLEVRSGGKNSIIPKPSQKGDLITVYSYKSVSDLSAGRIMGQGVVNIKGELAGRDLKIVRLLNMAFAASNIRLGARLEDMDAAEARLIEFIRVQCRHVTGMTVPADQILAFIKDLPQASPIPIDRIEEYNRLTVRQLEQSA